VPSNQNPDRPALVTAGTIEMAFGNVFFKGWEWHSPDLPEGTWAVPCQGLALMMGYSVRELHEMSHGADCRCPVFGQSVADGPLEYGYDEAPPFVPEASWEASRGYERHADLH